MPLKVAFFCQASSIKKSKYCCHPPFHPLIFRRHSLKLLSPSLPILMNWILLSPPPLSSDPDTPKIWNVHLFHGHKRWQIKGHEYATLIGGKHRVHSEDHTTTSRRIETDLELANHYTNHDLRSIECFLV